MDKQQIVSELSAQRAALRVGLDTLLESAVDAEGNRRSLTEDEAARFDTDEASIRGLDADIQRYRDAIDADAQHAEAIRQIGVPRVSVVSEPEVYRKTNDSPSYFRDVFRAGQRGDREAAERLRRNDAMVAEKRAITTVNGAGGEFVPPLWLEQDFVKLARPGRITANLVPTMPLPEGTDSINIPKINTGTAVAQMITQNTGVQQTDLTTTSIASSVITIAGGQTISLQLIEQSPVNIDMIVLSDLAAAYAGALNGLVLSGSGTGGVPTGILNVSGINAIDFASGTPTLGALYSKLANAVQQVHTKRFLPPDTIIMHPRRWAWALASLDSQNRPLIVPDAGGPFNAAGNQGDVSSQGFVGHMQGLPVFVDSLIPTNLTADAGTGEDAIIVARMSDLVLWESDIRAEAFQQTYANNMSVLVRLYNYASFQPARYPSSISVITGTGLAAPTF